ncbi:HAAS signaling domain-containing protein [Nocardioides aequoreus]|uniref:HAAS signaling domain-containing protein n=1 Tax=Nocardioides aequoreus TaxID=397278 RepID=UPI0004C41CE0|nr:hypothetical protein [Nocardioides aequoreus]
MTSPDRTAVDSYRERLLLALRMRDVPGDRIGEVLAEVEAHVAETGEDPVDAFGPPRRYADQVVEVSGRRGRWHLDRGTVVSSLLIAVVSFAATSLTMGGAVGVLGDGDPGPLGIPAGVELALGLALAAAVLTGLVRYTRRMDDPVVDPRSGQRVGDLPAWVPPTVFTGLFAAVVVLALVVDHLTS